MQSLVSVIEKQDVLNFLTLTMLPSPTVEMFIPLKLVAINSSSSLNESSYTKNLIPQILSIPASDSSALQNFSVSIALSNMIPK